MEKGSLRWASSDGAFLFQVPHDETMFSLETSILLSSSLYAISIFLEKGDLSFGGERLSIIRLNFHPPIPDDEEEEEEVSNEENEEGYVIHSTYKGGFGFQSIFHTSEINNELSEFEKAFLESVVNHVLEKLDKAGFQVSDIPFLQDNVIINDVELMLNEIDTKYKSLAASWSLAAGPESEEDRYDFSNVVYHGKINVKDLFYDLAEHADESLDELLLSKEGKMTLFRIAKSLVGLSALLYSDENSEKISDEELNFAHSEIILETSKSKRLFRLDVRAYNIVEEQYCDITIMG